jgi:hypothetical protein
MARAKKLDLAKPSIAALIEAFAAAMQRGSLAGTPPGSVIGLSGR